MSEKIISFYNEAKEKSDAAAAAFVHFEHDRAHIRMHREELAGILAEILSFLDMSAPDRELLPLCKLGIQLAVDIAATRICETNGDDYLITKPDAASDALRAQAVSAYDRFREIIRDYDRMYMADPIERDAPDAAKLRFHMRKYDEKRLQKNIQSQANNKSINKLFGSRG